MALTTRELADRAGVTPARVRQLILAGEIEAEKHGRDWLITEEEAGRWLREREIRESTSDPNG
jgi:excisionase family DNA binding protein